MLLELESFNEFNLDILMRCQLIFIVFLSGLLINCSNHGSINEVQYSGSLHDIMQGKIGATIALKEVEKIPNLYALGATEDLKGEIQIFNGIPEVSKKLDQTIILDHSFDASAELLVYTSVNEWENIEVPSMVKSQGQFDIFLVQEAKKAGIDMSKPFAFLLSGTILKLNWHIIDWDGSQQDHSPQNHLNSGLNGVLAHGDVEILGFYSTHHEGVFTHKGSKTHMHFRTNDTRLAGHVDRIFLGENMILKLPKK